MIRLTVPFISQFGLTANKYYGDCGPACVAMLLEYYNKLGKDTVNALADQTVLAGGARGLDLIALVELAELHGLACRINAPTTMAQIRAELAGKRPVLAGIKRLGLGHVVLVRGCDARGFYLHDPAAPGNQYIYDRYLYSQMVALGLGRQAVFINEEQG